MVMVMWFSACPTKALSRHLMQSQERHLLQQEARLREDAREHQHLQDVAASQEINTLVAQVRALQSKTEANHVRTKVGGEYVCMHVCE